MRPFPRTARRRLAAATAACSLAIGALAVPLASADPQDLKHKKHQAEQQVESAQQDLDESSEQLRTTQAAVAKAIEDLSAARTEYQAARVKLEAARAKDREMQQQLEAAEQRLTDAEVAVAGGLVDLQEQKDSFVDTVVATYEGGDPHLLALSALLNSKSTSDITRQQSFSGVVMSREQNVFDDLHAAEVRLQVREDQVQAAHDEVEAQRRAAAAHLVTMQNLTDETRTAKNKVLTLVDTKRDARAAAIAARQADREALREAKRRENRIKQQILAASRRAKGGYNGPTNGLFIRPVPGYVTSPFGYRIHPIYHYWGLHDGTDFGVSCGEPMRAIAGGTVIARYWSDVYGNRLYLSLGQINGKNVTAVYNHAESYRVGVGDKVAQGDTVGYVGSTGWSTGCHLHFTILVDGTAVDPMNWLP